MSGRKKTREPKEENVTLGPTVREGEQVFGVAHIFASFNDTFIVSQISPLSDLSSIFCSMDTSCQLSCEVFAVLGGMKVKADRDESSPYAAMLAAQDVAQRCKELGITALHIKLRATGGNKTKTPGPGAQSALRALARAGMKIGRIGKFFSYYYSNFSPLCIIASVLVWSKSLLDSLHVGIFKINSVKSIYSLYIMLGILKT
ncbi:hypothetical protein ZIOFF_028831 [Zingiber officinale]|uniref:40S ribosomal protein S14 n=1 Tax=Zingiber officinale TaxID=94328 RepID=A0A8J5L9L2_ZINOF|nr:hypothetical protein ZIOFF_028831 [Zingiber officinale]